jgi:hypothetical protein
MADMETTEIMPDETSNAMDSILAEEPNTEEVSEETTDVSLEGELETSADEAIVSEETETETADSAEQEPLVEEPVATVKPIHIEPVEAPEDIKFNIDPDLVDNEVKTAIDTMANILSEQRRELSVERERLRVERNNAFSSKIDNCFDKHAESLPNLGKTADLKRDNAVYREELYAHAKIISERRNISIDSAIEETVSMFKNKDGEKVAAQKLITNLNKQKGKFTNPPTRKHTDAGSRKYTSESERARAVIDEAYKVAGIL